MLTLPNIFFRAAQPTLGIREKVPMSGVPSLADRLFPRLFDFCARKALTPAGAPFFRYHVIDMDGLLDIELGLPVAAPVAGEGDVAAGMLPEGRYAGLTFWGAYDRLLDANAVLIGWARQKEIAWDMETLPDGDHFGCRLELYETDPQAEPDPSKWRTDVMLRLAD